MNADREQIYSGLSHAAWGYFFLNFDFNFNTVSIFPRFVGFLLLLSAIDKLSGERRDLALLRPLTMLLAVWSGLDWLVSWAGGDVDGHILFLDLLVAAAGLYFQFQFLTDMAALAEQYQAEGDALDQRLRRRRTAYIVLVTATALIFDVPAGLLGEWREVVALALAVAACIVALLVMTALFSLRRCFRETEAEGPSSFS